MAIAVADNFQFLGTKPLDSRIKYETIANMVATQESTLYDGCLAYVVAEKKFYSFDSTNDIDETLGKWREF